MMKTIWIYGYLFCLLVAVFLPIANAACNVQPKIAETVGDLEVVGLKAEVSLLKADLEARDVEITGLKVKNLQLVSEISGLRLTLGDVEVALRVKLENTAGRDTNSTAALIVAIVAVPFLVISYMIADRFPRLRKLKDFLKGKKNVN